MALQAEILQTKEQWNSVLNEYTSFDFVHTFDFHEISQKNGEGTPLLFSVKNEEGRCLVCWPTLRRGIPGTDRFDLGCVYGYGGGLVSRWATKHDLSGAFDAIFESMRAFGAVSLFSRMHPLFSETLIGSDIEGVDLGEVVVIDVAPTVDVLAGYRASHRYDIRRAANQGVEADVDFSCEHLDEFVEIYQQAMRDLESPNYYLFNEEYFSGMKAASDFKTLIIFGKYCGKRVAGAMFVVTENVMQYYLSGSLSEFRRLSASKLIIARAHELAIELGVEYIVLGGGVGSKSDLLFEFKSGFSKRVEKFQIFKKILDSDAYLAMCRNKGVDARGGGFFPAYRATP